MAHSLSIRRAQIPLECQLCEGSINVKWKCTECELLMCQKCTDKIHPKFKMADMHHVVEIKYAGSKDKEIIQKANRVKCKLHILQDYCIFCQTCDELVCPSCLTKSHQKHDLQEIDDVYNEDINSLKSCQAELNGKFLDVYEEQISKIEMTEVNNVDHLKMVKSKVEKQESKLLSALTSFKQTILEDLEKKSCDIDIVASTTKPTILQNIDEIRDKLDVIANVVNTNDVETVHKTANNLRKWLSSTPEPVSIHPTVFKLPDFFPKPIDGNTIGTLFGHLSTNVEKPISVLEVFESNTPSIDRLKVIDKNEIWISSVTTKSLRRISMNSSCTISTLQNFNGFEVYDMSLLSTQDLIFTTRFSESDIFVVTENEVKTFCSLAPLIPRALHVSREGLIYISTKESATVSQKTDSSIRQIVTLDQDKKQDIVFECTGTSNILTNITRIRGGPGCLYVIDAHLPNLEGRVISLGKEQIFKWIYDGHDTANESSFIPSDLEVTSTGKIIVCNMFDYGLHILGKDGNIIQHIFLSNFGINCRPCCLEIIQNDKMYIGCRQEEIDNSKNGTFYLVSLSEM